VNEDRLLLKLVIDGERESQREQPVVGFVGADVNACVDSEGIDVGGKIA
jgi:hypothetical protein